MTQYMSESDKPLLCEFTKEELDRCREGQRDIGRSEDEIEDKISRKVYESKEKLIRRYEGYLGIREDTGGNPIRTYRRWLRDIRGYDDEKIEKLASEEFNIPNIKDHNDWAPIENHKEEEKEEKEKESEIQTIYEVDEELRAKYEAYDYDSWVAEQREERENNVNTRRSKKDPKVRHTKKDDSKSRHKHRSRRHKSKY
jgi:hypothetical protein